MLRVQGNTVLWCLAHVLLIGFCNGLSGQLPPLSKQQQRGGAAWPQAGHQGHWGAAAAGAAALKGTVQASMTSSSSSSSSSRLPMLRLAEPLPIPFGVHTAAQLSMQGPRLLGRRARRPRHLAASHTATSASRAQPVLPYPRDPAGVQRYLGDAASSAPAAYTIPVWFVVVVDPANPQATNISSQQVAQQMELLNSAYATGLSSSSRGSVVTESGVGSNLRLGHAASTAPRSHAQMRTRRQPLSSSSSGSGSGGSAIRQLWRFQLMGIRYTSSSSPMCIGSSTEQRIKQDWRQKLVKEGGTLEDGTLVIYVSDITQHPARAKWQVTQCFWLRQHAV
ncbi:hypothetical protein COO60DRAFT_601672 [Scenedesmus sp. NREL 46B-D3]|nr:hypothetical protein COO60DRAFT_601672 [Scenedesmus sp. NREL 46B-D3]